VSARKQRLKEKKMNCKYLETCHIKVSFPDECRECNKKGVDGEFYQQWEETPEEGVEHFIPESNHLNDVVRGWRA